MAYDIDDLGIKDITTQQKLSGFKVLTYLGGLEILDSCVIEKFDFVMLEY
jgi:hypothetical protein